MRYKYVGKQRSMAANRLLFNGAEYELPQSDPHVKSLVAKKLLVPVKSGSDESPKPKTTKTKN